MFPGISMMMPSETLISVGVPHPKANARIRIGHDRARHLSVSLQLPQLLVSQSEPEAVFPRAREDLRHRGSDEVVEFIDVEEEVSAIPLRLPLPSHGELLKLRDQERAKEI